MRDVRVWLSRDDGECDLARRLMVGREAGRLAPDAGEEKRIIRRRPQELRLLGITFLAPLVPPVHRYQATLMAIGLVEETAAQLVRACIDRLELVVSHEARYEPPERRPQLAPIGVWMMEHDRLECSGREVVAGIVAQTL